MSTKIKIARDKDIPYLENWLVKWVELLDLEFYQQAQAILVRSTTRITKAMLNQAPDCLFIGTATSGTDHIDKNACQERAITVCDAAGCNTQAVVEYVISSLVALDVLKGTIGIIGGGRIGSRLRSLLQRCGFECLIYDPFLNDKHLPLVSLEEVLAADIISLHVPYTTQGDYPTANMLAQKELDLISSSSIIINTSRGGIICEDALKDKLRTCPKMHAIIDVWQQEPNIDRELMQLTAIATPHIAGHSQLAKFTGSMMIAQQCVDFFHLDIDIVDREAVQHTLCTQNISQAILQAYNPLADDAQLKAQGSNFAALRNHYPNRYQWSEYHLSGVCGKKWGFS